MNESKGKECLFSFSFLSLSTFLSLKLLGLALALAPCFLSVFAIELTYAHPFFILSFFSLSFFLFSFFLSFFLSLSLSLSFFLSFFLFFSFFARELKLYFQLTFFRRSPSVLVVALFLIMERKLDHSPIFLQ